ncbi:ECF subfamily RNA polymerase sigma factor, BldN family [Micromonospora sp. SL4-19]|uniref:ECF subfamily RNA polymerase sigma factor, BldN family n=1 Tax=Micromonospora sp. SL4-19 TaxID=3399129 RepID=UPI003A4E1423
MTTFGYAERPAGVTGPTQRTPVNERLEPRTSTEGMWSLAVRGEGARRVRNRSHHNEAPPRPVAPGGNAKPAASRLGAPSRPAMPAQGRRAGESLAAADPSATETAVLPAVPAADTAVLPVVPAAATPATGYPSRPDPSDPATEVWALVERAQAGEAEAFGLIYDRYVDTVFRFVYFRVGNRQLAEDLTSDTFLRALKRIGSFTWQGRDLGAWLVTIARNLVADHFKSGRYRLEVTTGDVLDADREDRGPEGSPEAAVVEHITNVALLTAVKQLNPEQQECIVLRFLQGFSVAETARAMGKNEGAIKALQYRAVRALARLLPDGFQA